MAATALKTKEQHPGARLAARGLGMFLPAVRIYLMSAVSSSVASPNAEQAASRRRAPERGSDGAAAPFSLPEGGGDPEVPAAAKDDAAATKPEAGGKASATQEQKATASALATVQPAVLLKGTTAVVVPAEAAEATPTATQPKPDIGALVAIAVAEQAAAGKTAVAGKPGVEEKPTDSEPKEAASADKPVEAAVVMPIPAPAAIPVVVALPLVGGDIAAAGIGDEAVPGGTKAAQGIPTGMAQAAMPAQTLVPAEASVMAAVSATDAAASTSEGDEVGKPAEKPHAGPMIAASKETATGPANTTVAAGQPLADLFKPVEVQQAPVPIELSAAVASHSGKPEGIAGLPDIDLAKAAQQPSAGMHRGMADGQPTPLHVVPIEIGLRALAGSKRFDIRLDPPELGRVDVNLEISEKGEVSAKLVVDRVETLHLLQRDARTLERAFEQAGLKPSDSGVDITLRDPNDQPGFRQQRQDDEAPRRARIQPDAAELGDASAIPAQPAPIRRLVRLGGVDLSI